MKKVALGLICLLAAACVPTTSAPPPPPANPTCDVHGRFWGTTVHVWGTTNLPPGTSVRVNLYGNGTFSDSISTTVPSAQTVDVWDTVPDWGYSVWWGVEVMYAGRAICTAGALQGWEYITDPAWWEFCAVDPECFGT